MTKHVTGLAERIDSGKPILLADFSPPQATDSTTVRDIARRFSGKVHALGISDNWQRVTMSALASASLVAAEGVEPILHVTTRDRNRIALISDVLGAQALGIRNLFCTSGTHQTLGHYRAAKNVYDLDSIQLLQTVSCLPVDCRLVGEDRGIEGVGPFCLGGVASPFSDPQELQIARLEKKTQAGAKFMITQPVFDLDRFGAWWQEVTRRGIHERVAVVADVEALVNGHLVETQADKRLLSRIPAATLTRIQSASGPVRQRDAAIEVAQETLAKLASFRGLRGFCISGHGDPDAALAILEKSGLGSN